MWTAKQLRNAAFALSACSELLARVGQAQGSSHLAECARLVSADPAVHLLVLSDRVSDPSNFVRSLLGSASRLSGQNVPTGSPCLIANAATGSTGRFTESISNEIEISPTETIGTRQNMSSPATTVPTLWSEAQFLENGMSIAVIPDYAGCMKGKWAGWLAGRMAECDGVLYLCSPSSLPVGRNLELLRHMILSNDRNPPVIGVVNKAELRPDWPILREDLRRRLTRRCSVGSIFAVSANQYIEGRQAQDQRISEQAGIDQLRWYLSVTLFADVMHRRLVLALDSGLKLAIEARLRLDTEYALVASDTPLDASSEEMGVLADQLAVFESALLADLQTSIGQLRTDLNEQLDQQADAVRARSYALIDNGDPVSGWQGIATQVEDDVRRLETEHLSRLSSEVRRSIDRALYRHGLDGYLSGSAAAPSPGRASGAATLAAPAASNRPRSGAVDLARSGLSTALMASAAIGAIASLPVVMVVGAGAASAGLVAKSFVGRRQETDIMWARDRARREVEAFLQRKVRELRNVSSKHDTAVRGWLTADLAREIGEGRTRAQNDVRRLAERQADSERQREESDREHQQAIAELDRAIALIRKVRLNLERPELSPETDRHQEVAEGEQ